MLTKLTKKREFVNVGIPYIFLIVYSLLYRHESLIHTDGLSWGAMWEN